MGGRFLVRRATHSRSRDQYESGWRKRQESECDSRPGDTTRGLVIITGLHEGMLSEPPWNRARPSPPRSLPARPSPPRSFCCRRGSCSVCCCARRTRTRRSTQSLAPSGPGLARDQHPVEQQMWGMVLSERHFGNPLSSIDYVVAHWRNDTVEPTTCFAQAQSMRIGAVDQYDWRQQLAAARQRLAAAQTLH